MLKNIEKQVEKLKIWHFDTKVKIWPPGRLWHQSQKLTTRKTLRFNHQGDIVI